MTRGWSAIRASLVEKIRLHAFRNARFVADDAVDAAGRAPFEVRAPVISVRRGRGRTGLGRFEGAAVPPAIVRAREHAATPPPPTEAAQSAGDRDLGVTIAAAAVAPKWRCCLP